MSLIPAGIIKNLSMNILFLFFKTYAKFLELEFFNFLGSNLSKIEMKYSTPLFPFSSFCINSPFLTINLSLLLINFEMSELIPTTILKTSG